MAIALAQPMTPLLPATELLERAAAEHGAAAARTFLQAAKALLQAEEVREAVQALRSGLDALAKMGGSAEARDEEAERALRGELEFELGRIFEEQMGRVDAALLCYQRAFKARPSHSQALMRGRAIYLQLGDTAMASRLFELELTHTRNLAAEARLELALSYARLKLRQKHDPAGAAAVLEEAISRVEAERVPLEALETLALSYVSPDYATSAGDEGSARALRRAGEIYLDLARRQLEGRGQEGQAGAEAATNYLRRALGADPGNSAAAIALEGLYERLPSPQREAELIRLYLTVTRMPRRGLKLLQLHEATGEPERTEVIAALRACLEDADSLSEWQETRAALRRLYEASGDLKGLAGLLEQDAAEAALPEERADLLIKAADLHKKAGSAAEHLLCLEQAFAEMPLGQEAFRRLSEHHLSRRDFMKLRDLHEARIQALISAEELDLDAHAALLEELADLYEKKLKDVAAAADTWRRIDEVKSTPRSQAERRRLGGRLTRIQLQVAELSLELEHAPEEAAGTRAEILRKLAQHHKEQHDTWRAAAHYEELLALVPSDVSAMKALFELREQLGDIAGQVGALRKLIGHAADRAERLSLLRRLISLCIGRTESAEDMRWACRSLLSELPSDREALRRLAEAEEQLGDLGGFLETLEAHVKVAPTPKEKLPLHISAARAAERGKDLDRAISHLERAVRICPPGPELEALLLDLARVYGLAGRLKEQLQAIELCIQKNPRPQVEVFRMLGRAALREPRDAALEERGLRAYNEVLARLPSDAEAMEALAGLYRQRESWRELAELLGRWLAVPDQPPEQRLAAAVTLADVLSQRLDDRERAVAVLRQILVETPVCDPRLHQRLRLLHEEDDVLEAIRSGERELLLTEDPLARMELGMHIARLWRSKVRDPGRALLAFERILDLLPRESGESGMFLMERGQRIVAQALDAMSEIHAEMGRFGDVIALGEHRIALAQAEPTRAACIFMELAAVKEEKMGDPRGGFALRRKAWELAPEMVSIGQLSDVASRFSLWEELLAVHLQRIQGSSGHGPPPRPGSLRKGPLDSVIAAARLYEEKLQRPKEAYQILRDTLPSGAQGAIACTTLSSEGRALLAEILAMMRRLHVSGRTREAAEHTRDLIRTHHAFVDDLCGQRGGVTEETSLRLHELLGNTAALKEEILGDARGALDERLRAFTLGGERDHGSTDEASAVFANNIAEIRRLALVTSQVKEAMSMDARRLERAEGELRKEQVSADIAFWIDEYVNDPPRAVRACLKALSLCAEGGGVQAELRGRLFALGRKLGTLVWEEIARAERSVPGGDAAALGRRLVYVASLWENGAGEIMRAIEAIGQAYKLTFFPAAEGQAQRATAMADGAGNPDAQVLLTRRELRAELDRLAGRAPSDTEGMARVVNLLDSIAAQLADAGDAPAAVEVLLDAARTDERRGRLPHAERRYLEVLRSDPGCNEALDQLERLYRQSRRTNDLVNLLEKRRTGLLERLGPGPARRAMFVELGEAYAQLGKVFEALDVYASMAAEDEADPEPYHLMARLHESQRAFARAAESYAAEAERAHACAPARALHARLRAGEIWEKHVGSPERALLSYQAALREVSAAEKEVAGDQAAELAVALDRAAVFSGAQRILERQQRYTDLDAMYAQRLEELAQYDEPMDGVASSRSHPPMGAGERVELLGRRIRLLLERLKGQPGEGEGGSLGEALHLARQLASLVPMDDEALSLLEQLLTRLGQPEESCQVARQRALAAARRGDGEEVQAALWVSCARQLLSLGQIEEAEEALRTALALRPDDLPSRRMLSELRLRRGDTAGYLVELIDLAGREKDAGHAAGHLLRAAEIQLGELRQPQAARALLERVLAMNGGDDGDVHSQQALRRLSDLTYAGGESAAEDYLRRELRVLSGARSDPSRSAELHHRLGRLAMDRSDYALARQELEAALDAAPAAFQVTIDLVTVLGLLTDHVPDAEQRSHALLCAALERAHEAFIPAKRAELLRRLAETSARLGRTEEAYAALREAEAIAPLAPAERLKLGQLAHHQGDHALAVQAFLNLQAVSPGEGGLSAQALADAFTIHGARSAVLAGDLDAARALLRAALALSPGHIQAEDAYIELLCAGPAPGRAEPDPPDPIEEAVALLVSRAERSAEHPALAVSAYRGAAHLCLTRLADAARAGALLSSASRLIEGREDLVELAEQILSSLLDLERARGDLARARVHARGLVELAAPGPARARHLRRLAELELEAAERDAAREHLAAAVSEAPLDLPALMLLGGMLPDDQAAALLSERLPPFLDIAGAPEAERQALSDAFSTLGTLLARLDDTPRAVAAFEQAIAAAAGLPPRVELELRRTAIEVLDLSDADAARRHLEVLLREDATEPDALLRLYRLEMSCQQIGAAERIAQALVVLAPRGMKLPELSKVPPLPATVALEEKEITSLADAEARAFADVMATLWEGIASSKAPSLDVFGVGPAERLPPSESSHDEVARMFAACCRVLGNRKATLYRNASLRRVAPQMSALPPGSLIVGPHLPEQGQSEALFLIGRGVALLRPEYILAESFASQDLSQLLALAVRAFHPRHIRHASEQVAAWRRDLPYRAVKRLSDLFRDQADVPFSSSAWRGAVRRAANRLGLLLSGDLPAAVRMLAVTHPDHAEEDRQDLLRFWLSAEVAPLADRLHPYPR